MAQYVRPAEYKDKLYKFPMPSENLDPKLKETKEYFLAVMNSVAAEFYSNTCFIPSEFPSKRGFEELRAYATGQQPIAKLQKNLFSPRQKKEDGTYMTKMNVSFDTYYKMSQLLDVVRSKNMNQEYGVDINCIDSDSIAAKNADREMLKFLLDRETKRFMEITGYKPGAQIDPQAMGMRTAQDVDLYFETGGYTLQWEMAATAACEKTKMSSNYKVLQDETFDDLIINPYGGITGWKTFIDKSTKIPGIRKLDPKNCVIPYSKRYDFSDITRGGEFRVVTIADVRRMNPALTAEDLMYIAKCHQWLNGDLKNFDYRMREGSFYGQFSADPISRVKVLVLDYQWLSVDVETNIKNTFRNGSTFFKPVDYDFEIDEKARKSGDKKIAKNVIKKYEADWIVGTDMFISYGIAKDVVYYGEDGNKTPRIDFFFTRTGNASLVERGVAIIDDIDLALIKQRNTIATFPASPGMAIQKDLVENVFLNGVLQQPEDIIQVFIEKGILYYNGLDDHGKPLYMAGGAKPIDFVNLSQLAQTVAMWSNHILAKVAELREVLGMQNGADAGQASPYQGLGQTKLAFQAANDSLYPTFNAYNYLFKAAFTDIIKKWQIVAKDNDIPLTYAVLGNKNLEVLRLSYPFTNAEFNCEITVAPTNEEKQNLLTEIAGMKQLGIQSNGAQGITTAEYLYLYKKIMAGMIDEALFVLASIEAKKRAEASAITDKNQQANIQDQQQSAALKAQADQALQEQKGQQTIQNTLVNKLLEQNTTLMQIAFTPQKMGDGAPQAAQIEQVIGANNQVIGGVVAPPEPPPAMPPQGAPEGIPVEDPAMAMQQ